MNRESCVTKVGGIKPAHLHESTAGSGKSRVDDKGPWPPAAPASTPRHKKNVHATISLELRRPLERMKIQLHECEPHANQVITAVRLLRARQSRDVKRLKTDAETAYTYSPSWVISGRQHMPKKAKLNCSFCTSL